MNVNTYPILSLINSVKDLRVLSKNILPKLCNELRKYLLDNISRTSGHFASGLGVIEITVALHYVYNTPFDHLIWDVGHQAYSHKILTGRKKFIKTIRKKNGLHSFPCREESEFDALTVGHSSTSISAGLGMAVASKKENKNRKTICIIGDGAITAGMAFEAINHAGDIKPNILVLLNDNKMSISKNVGALSNRLTQLLSGQAYEMLKNKSKKILNNIPKIKKLLQNTEKKLKNILSPKNKLFEELGFNYIGPIDGHNVIKLINILNEIKVLKGPQILHVITKKGKGYSPAEKDPVGWHAVPQFDISTGLLPVNKNIFPSYSKIFGDWLCEIATNDKKLMAITPAMSEGSGMVHFSRKFPEQYFDVAIAEQHAVTFAAGLSIGGLKPVVAIYSTFLQRAYDQLIHDIAIQKLPVLFAIDRSGIVGPDGPTHQGSFDITYLRCIPGIIIMTPSDENECRNMLYTGYLYDKGPSAVRYPKGNGTGIKITSMIVLPIGKGLIKRLGKNIAILNFGALLNEASIVAEKLNATLVDMRFVKPLDELLILDLADKHDSLITLEEGVIKGGAGSGVNEILMFKRKKTPVLNIGIPDIFVPQGTQEEIKHELHLDSEGIFLQIQKWLYQ